MTAATHFAGDIIWTGASYGVAWQNSRLLCSAPEAGSDWWCGVSPPSIDSAPRFRAALCQMWHSYTPTSAHRAFGYLVGPGLGEKERITAPLFSAKLPLNTHALYDCLSLTEFTFHKVHITNLLFRVTVHYPWNMGIVGSRWKAASVQSTRINLPDCSAQDFTSAAWDQDLCNLVGRTAFAGFHWG